LRFTAKGRPNSTGMNKTEAKYQAMLEGLKQAGEILWYAFEPINLRLAQKTYYRPDFLVMNKHKELEVHEVKGFWQDDAKVKIKVASEKFPFKFIAVQLKKGQWVSVEY
jgi:hypothetical protein